MTKTDSKKSYIGTRTGLPKSPGKKVQYRHSSYSRSYADDQFIDTLVVIPPDGGWGWVIIMVSFCCNFVADGTMYTFGLFLGDVAKSLDCEETQVAVANSVMTGFYFISGPFVSALTNKFGFRKVAVTGGLMASLTLFITSISKSIIPIMVSYGIFGGMGFGMMYLPSIIITGFYFEKWRAVANAIAVCGSSLGIVCFPALFSDLLRNFHWRIKFRILAGAVCICGLLTFCYRPLRPVRVVSVDNKGTGERILSMSSTYVDDSGGGREFSRHHNLGYPTTATIHSGSTVTLVEPRRLSNTSILLGLSGPSTSSWSNNLSIKGDQRKLKTVLEEREEELSERELTKCKRCCRKCAICLCCCCHKRHEEVVDVEEETRCQDYCNRIGVCCCYFCLRRTSTYASRPLYRDDIFYSGSLLVLPEYNKGATTKSQQSFSETSRLEYHLSVTRIATQKDLEEDYDKCVCCAEAMKRTLGTMLDASVLKSSSFLIVCLSGFFTFLGLYVPILFVVERAKEQGMDSKLASYLISTLGIFNTLGRILSGLLLTIPHVNTLRCSYISLFICGLSTALSHLATTNIWQFVYVSIYGLNICTVAALRHLIFIELLGLEKLTNSFGISLMFSGVACLISIPAAGFLKEWSGDYTIPFIAAGSCMMISAVLLVPVRVINKRERAAEGISESSSIME